MGPGPRTRVKVKGHLVKVKGHMGQGQSEARDIDLNSLNTVYRSCYSYWAFLLLQASVSGPFFCANAFYLQVKGQYLYLNFYLLKVLTLCTRQKE